MLVSGKGKGSVLEGSGLTAGYNRDTLNCSLIRQTGGKQYGICGAVSERHRDTEPKGDRGIKRGRGRKTERERKRQRGRQRGTNRVDCMQGSFAHIEHLA